MVNGGYCISIMDDDLICEIFKGWYKYRELVDGDIKLKHNKINNWNTIWLLDSCSDKITEEFDFDKFLKVDEKEGGTNFDTQFWAKVIFMLTKKINKDIIISYVYQLGQQNKTIGFIPIKLNESKKIITFYKKYFGESDYLKNKDSIELLFGNFYYNFESAVNNGIIGYQTLKPKYYEVKIKKEENKLIYNTYKTWIMVMLNEKAKKLDELSDEFANYLFDFSNRDTKTMKKDKSSKRNFITDFFNKTMNRNSFIGKIAELSREDNENKYIFKNLSKEMINLDNSSVKLFVDLTSIKYDSLNK
jgi:hypothetical protein